MSKMSLPFSNNDIKVKSMEEGGATGGDGDEDSVIELGQIAILGSSRPSLRYRSATEMNASKRSLSSRHTATAGVTADILANSRLLVNKFGSRTESIVEAAAAEEKEQQQQQQQQDTAADGVDVTLPTAKPQSMLMQYFNNFKGYLYGIISALIFVLSQVIMRRSIWLSGPDHVVIRLVIAFIIFYTYLKYKDLPVLGPKHLFRLLVFRGFLGCVAIVTIYFAILFVDPSDVVSLTHTSLIMTAILGKIFLKEKLTIAHFIGILFTAAGVIFITQPTFIFPHRRVALAAAHNQTNETTTSMASSSSSSKNQNQFGIILTLVAAFLVSCTYLVIKKLAMCKVHWATNTLFVSLVGLPFCVVFSVVLVKVGWAHANFAAERKDLSMDLFYSILAGTLSNVAQIFLNLALQYEDTTKIAITKTTDVFIAFVLQFLLLDIAPDSLSILGACFILLATFFILIYKMLLIRYENSIENEEQIEQQQQQQQPPETATKDVVIGDVKIEEKIKNKILKKKSIKNFLLKIFFFQF